MLPIIPPLVGTPTPPFVAGFVFLGLRSPIAARITHAVRQYGALPRNCRALARSC